MKKQFFTFLWLLFVSLQTFGQFLPSGDPVQEGLTKEGLQRVSSFLNQAAQEKKIPGSVTMIVRNGKVLFQQASGKANVETGESMRMDHLFRMASMTKFVTTVAALKLFERGLFTMDTPLESILPEFANPVVFIRYDAKKGKFITKPAKNKILMKHVFTHTSGIVYPQFTTDGREGYLKTPIAAAFPAPNAGITLAGEIKKLAKLPLTHEPGESWTYGMNMDVLGRVIEVMTGKSFPQFVREEVLQPLKMNRSFFGVPADEWKNVTQVYTPGEKGFMVYDTNVLKKLMFAPETVSMDYYKATNTNMAMGGADLISCAQDYARFLQMILNYGELDGARILSKKTVEMIERPLFEVETKDIVAQGISNKIAAGLSVVIYPERLSKFKLISAGTFYWAGYFNTHFWIDRRENMFAIVLSQYTPDPDDHNAKFRHLAWGSIGK